MPLFRKREETKMTRYQCYKRGRSRMRYLGYTEEEIQEIEDDLVDLEVDQMREDKDFEKGDEE